VALHSPTGEEKRGQWSGRNRRRTQREEIHMKYSRSWAAVAALSAPLWFLPAPATATTSATGPARCGGLAATMVVTGDSPRVVYGTSGDDVIVVQDAGHMIRARAGDDRVCGSMGADVLRGGPGADSLHGRGGDDVVGGGADDDSVYGGRGDDSMYGGPGNDSMYGGGGNDHATGGSGEDSCDGGSGTDSSTSEHDTTTEHRLG
jgi:hypothetical protein